MTQDILYTGISATPDDYQSPDGQLDLALNLVYDHDAIRPISAPATIPLPDGLRALYIHQNSSYSNLICAASDGSLCFLDYHSLDPSSVQPLYGNAQPPTASSPTAPLLKSLSAPLNNQSLSSISSVGNTLILFASDGLHYLLFQPATTSYRYLGQRPPFLHLSFSGDGDQPFKPYANGDHLFAETHVSSLLKEQCWELGKTAIVNSGSNYAYFRMKSYRGDTPEEKYTPADVINVFQGLEQEAIDDIHSFVDSVNNEVASQNHFFAPFFVRYCYRLFDGSAILHSAPIFMPILNGHGYPVEIAGAQSFNEAESDIGGSYYYPAYDDIDGILNVATPASIEISANGEEVTTESHQYMAYRYQPCNFILQYALLGNSDILRSLQHDWKDIVKSIDIFVSRPLERNQWANLPSDTTLSLSFANLPFLRYQHTNKDHTTPYKPLDFTEQIDGQFYFNLPLKSDDIYLRELRDITAFYRIASIPLDQLAISYSFLPVPIEPYTLATLANQEQLTDDYHTHNTLLPTNPQPPLFNFNNRLIIPGANEQLFDGFTISSMLALGFLSKAPYYYITPLVTLSTDYGDLIVRAPSSIYTSLPALRYLPLFYPDRRAKTITLYIQQSGTTGYQILQFPMQESNTLNGAFSLVEVLDDTSSDDYLTPPSPISDPDLIQQLSDLFTSPYTPPIIPSPNTLFTSEVENPFFFPSSSSNLISEGRILGIAAATKALSEGQFGQFPLYIFSSDGLYALTTAADGSFVNHYPVSRDVCINPNSITSIDNAVIFATTRGLMLVSGSQVWCISDDVNQGLPLSALSLLSSSSPNLNLLISQNLINAQSQIFSRSSLPLSDYLSAGIVLYDYINQRIILSNPNYPLSLVYSLRSKSWASTLFSASSRLNSYPNTLCIDTLGQLRSLDLALPSAQPLSSTDTDTTPTSSPSQLLITRPLKLGSPDTLKTLHTLIQRGVFQQGDVQTLLYGSRDLLHWHLIASSSTHIIRHLRGTPYKYFRVVALASLSPEKSLIGLSLDYQPRHLTHLI